MILVLVYMHFKLAVLKSLLAGSMLQAIKSTCT